jgi:hypothetical protein
MNSSDNNPYESQDSAQSSGLNNDKGSMFLGFFISWGVLLAGPLLTWLFVMLASTFGGFIAFGFTTVILQLIPLVFVVGLMVWFGKQGKSKTVKGMAAGIASIIALILLLVAACFGILASW